MSTLRHHGYLSKPQVRIRTVVVEVRVHVGEIIVQGRVQAKYRGLSGKALHSVRILLASGVVQRAELDALDGVRTTSTLLARNHTGSGEAS
jgi:hypothetical protein